MFHTGTTKRLYLDFQEDCQPKINPTSHQSGAFVYVDSESGEYHYLTDVSFPKGPEDLFYAYSIGTDGEIHLLEG